MIEFCNCTACNARTDIDLLDGKDDGSGDYNRIECPKCYGPGWVPAREVKRYRRYWRRK